MKDVIIILILMLIVGSAAGYIYKAKKSGKTCIGCPHAEQCGSGAHVHGRNGTCADHCGSCGGCSGDDNADRDDTQTTES